MSSLRDYALKCGFTPEEIEKYKKDPRLVNALRNSMSFESGGMVNGPGTSTSDSIPARLSDGEYVIRAAAVKVLGKDFLDRLNAMGGK